MKVGKKQRVLEVLFNQCRASGVFVFDNDLVKDICRQVGFGNPFDVSKLDNTKIFPQVMLEEDYFLVHLGRGRHQFVRGIANAFHRFEAIGDAQVQDWEYKKSILNEVNTSESNILSLGVNHKIIHHFLYGDITANPKIYNANRTQASLAYRVGNTQILPERLQMEIDMTMEKDGVVTVFEGKNQFPEDFAVSQIFLPHLYYRSMKELRELIKSVNCCYVLRDIQGGQSVIRLYLYGFGCADDLSSIELIKSRQYNLVAK